MRAYWVMAAILAATTIGAGVFALPYLFAEAGWLVGDGHLLALSSFVVFANGLYFKTLQKNREKKRLLNLARERFNGMGFGVALLAIFGGLMLSHVAYLVLGGDFLRIVFPGLAYWPSILIFWAVGIAPLIFATRSIASLEFFGAGLLGLMAVWLFGGANIGDAFVAAPAADISKAFLPFGAVLFSLSGWTAVEPMYEAWKRAGGRARPWLALILGAVAIVIAYLLFVIGTLGAGVEATPDTLSGIMTALPNLAKLFALFGLVALWTSYVPIGLELINLISKDLRWKKSVGVAAVVFLPIVLVAMGLRSFLEVIGIAGGIFTSTQHIIILLVGVSALSLKKWNRGFAYLAVLVFALAALYEIWFFVIG